MWVLLQALSALDEPLITSTPEDPELKSSFTTKSLVVLGGSRLQSLLIFQMLLCASLTNDLGSPNFTRITEEVAFCREVSLRSLIAGLCLRESKV